MNKYAPKLPLILLTVKKIDIENFDFVFFLFFFFSLELKSKVYDIIILTICQPNDCCTIRDYSLLG